MSCLQLRKSGDAAVSNKTYAIKLQAFATERNSAFERKDVFDAVSRSANCPLTRTVPVSATTFLYTPIVFVCLSYLYLYA